MSDQEKRRPDEPEDGVSPRDGESAGWDDGEERDVRAADERLDDDPSPADEAAGEAEERDEEPGPRRPPLLVIIGSALMLVAIGVGLGVLIPSGPSAASLVPTGVPLPTALPLPEAIGEPDSTDPIVRVGDVEIPRGDFVRLYQPGANPQDLIDQLIMRELVIQAAVAEGVEVDEEAVTAQVDQIKAQSATEAEFETFLKDNGLIDEANLRRLIGRDLLIEQMVLRHTEAEQVNARHILLAEGAAGAEGEAGAEGAAESRQAEAEDLLQQLEDGADFAALAREHSDDSGSAEQGGDLGWAPRGAFVGPFDEAVFSMELGERRLVQSQFGWHIIELVALPEVRPFESMDLLNTQFGQEAFQTSFLPWADQLKADAEAANRIEVLVEASELVNDPAQS